VRGGSLAKYLETAAGNVKKALAFVDLSRKAKLTACAWLSWIGSGWPLHPRRQRRQLLLQLFLNGDELVGLSDWRARRRRGPKL